MTVVSAEALEILERKSALYEDTKEQVMARIRDNIGTAIGRLQEVERELLGEVEIEFGENPFEALLGSINSGNSHTEKEIRDVLSKEIPGEFETNEESFTSLLREIEAFKTLQRKTKRMRLDMVPKNIKATKKTCDTISISWDAADCDCFYETEIESGGAQNTFQSFKTEHTFSGLDSDTEYHIRVRTVMLQGNNRCTWSEPITVRTQHKFYYSVWKRCPNYAEYDKRYSINKYNTRIATNSNKCSYSTVIGDTPIPQNQAISWSIKICIPIKVRAYDDYDYYDPYDDDDEDEESQNISIGIAPFNINQNDGDGNVNCGWYFDYHKFELWSGVPHNYNGVKYGPRKEYEGYRDREYSVGVVMDTRNGNLSFVVGGVNLGVAYEGIPLDEPLVPCVILGGKGSSAELDLKQVKENEIDRSIPVPSNLTTRSTAWDSIYLTWDPIERASFYQVEVDGNKSWESPRKKGFTKRELLPDTEHTFRVRAVKKNSVSEWSDVVKERTLKGSFKTSGWKECPDDVDEKERYSVKKKNSRIARKDVDDDYCIIIGNTPLPPNKVTSWSIKIRKSRYSDGALIGIAPSDIDRSRRRDRILCGWYFDCFYPKLLSGPPHNYTRKEYGPKKEEGYAHTGDSIGAVMDTTKGELSFIVYGINLGVAYEGIPLDKPLVPCVLLRFGRDSIELDTSEVKETVVDSSIPIPSNVTAKRTTWDSLTLTWDAVEGASFYQIEMDGRKPWIISTTRVFTKRGLLPETKYTFRVRTVRRDSGSEWSLPVTVRTENKSFESCSWMKCPENVDGKMKYSVDTNSSRVAIKMNGDDNYSTIIGDKAIPLGKTVSWNIQILKSKKRDGNLIYVGVAPSDINQNEDNNFRKCGWYISCFRSKLWSGPPHRFKGTKYGPEGKEGKYVREGDRVKVTMDTTKGELSFTLKNSSLGAAFTGIPLDKPLVPCVLLGKEGDSVNIEVCPQLIRVSGILYSNYCCW